MNIRKKIAFSTVCIITFLTLFIYTKNNATKVYADINDATVVTSSGEPSTDITTTDTTTSENDASVVTTARRAPVSITVYSNVVTESADTYDYSQPVVSISPIESATPVDPGTGEDNISPIESALPVESAPPAGDTPPSEEVPQGTGNPDEPDMLTYPPTEAPEYTD